MGIAVNLGYKGAENVQINRCILFPRYLTLVEISRGYDKVIRELIFKFYALFSVRIYSRPTKKPVKIHTTLEVPPQCYIDTPLLSDAQVLPRKSMDV